MTGDVFFLSTVKCEAICLKTEVWIKTETEWLKESRLALA